MSHLRWLTARASHGPHIIAIVEGVPAGLALLEKFAGDSLKDLSRNVKTYVDQITEFE